MTSSWLCVSAPLIPAPLFARLPHLKLLVTTGMRNAAVGLAAAKAHGVTVCGTASNFQPPAELTWALLLGLARNLVQENDVLRTGGPWQSTLHLVLSERTRGLLGASELARMRPYAYLVNTSRAQIVDRDALAQALRDGRIAGAGLDVFETEPLSGTHIFRELPNVLATPHLGYVTHDNYRTYYREAVEDIQAFLAGAPIRTLG